MKITECTNQNEWDNFLKNQRFRPFLQSWTMGEVYKDVGQDPIRLSIEDNKKIIGICQCINVPARRGKHLTISYGPVLRDKGYGIRDMGLEEKLKEVAKKYDCNFIRMSPFIPIGQKFDSNGLKSPLHLLAEHIWYLPLKEIDIWDPSVSHVPCPMPPSISNENLLKNMRKNHRNLIRRAEREGVVVSASKSPMKDIKHFHKLHDETRKRHKFTPYTKKFFDSQVKYFSSRNECTLYLAEYKDEVIAASIHMHTFGETSYHHGASTSAYPKIPASYLLQWTAIKDAIARGDNIYSFWGIAPEGIKKHPFRGVTTFKRGFGGKLLELKHCTDISVNKKYFITRTFEYIRKWKRGF